MLAKTVLSFLAVLLIISHVCTVTTWFVVTRNHVFVWLQIILIISVKSNLAACDSLRSYPVTAVTFHHKLTSPHHLPPCVLQVLVKDINVTSNVVGATNQEGLYERLEELQGQLTLCEKALAEYLETKRLAFPR